MKYTLCPNAADPSNHYDADFHNSILATSYLGAVITILPITKQSEVTTVVLSTPPSFIAQDGSIKNQRALEACVSLRFSQYLVALTLDTLIPVIKFAFGTYETLSLMVFPRAQAGT